MVAFSAVDAQSRDNSALNSPFIVAVIPEGMTEPLDVADVRLDRFMVIGENVLSLGPDDGFIVSGSHHNAGQSYLLEDLFHIREGRLRAINEKNL